jgi:hypothetical protein
MSSNIYYGRSLTIESTRLTKKDGIVSDLPDGRASGLNGASAADPCWTAEAPTNQLLRLVGSLRHGHSMA